MIYKYIQINEQSTGEKGNQDLGHFLFHIAIYIGTQVAFNLFSAYYVFLRERSYFISLDFIKTFPHGKAEYCWICYDKENITARNLYLSMGFQEIGEQGEDIDAVIKL